MIDGLFKRHIDPVWEGLARPVARVMTANQVTLAGLVLVAALSAAFIYHGSTFWFGIALIFAFSADSLDGAVARLRGESSHFGGYLDAVVDRYQELFVLAAVAQTGGHWAAAFAVLTGAYLTSYAKARTAIEMPVSNTDWPDLFERQERIIFLCLLLIVNGVAGARINPYVDLMGAGLWLMAVLCHVTALQRSWRALGLLAEALRRRAMRRRVMWRRSFLVLVAMVWALVGARAGEPGSFGYPVPQEPNQVFFLQRSMNSNTIVYAANMDAAGKFSRSEPIKVYWRRYNDNGEKKDLSFAEDRFAFGVIAKPMPGEANAFRIIIRSYPDRSAVLRVVNGKPRLETKLHGQEVQLISAFLHLEGEGSMPKVKTVEVWGRSLATGEPASDSFSP